MSESSHAYRRMGFWSATSVATIGVVYGIVGLIGVVARPPGRDPFHQIDPYLAILEILMILSTVALVVMMAAVYAYAPPDRKTHGLAALACIIVFAVLTCSVHFASLTVGRQIDSKVLPLLSQQLSFAQWPTLALALDLLAWDFFLALAMLFAASVFKSDGLPNRVRVSLIVGGTFCLVGTLGPALGYMRIQYLGIAGYAFVLPVACVLLAMLLRRTASL